MSRDVTVFVEIRDPGAWRLSMTFLLTNTELMREFLQSAEKHLVQSVQDVSAGTQQWVDPITTYYWIQMEGEEFLALLTHYYKKHPLRLFCKSKWVEEELEIIKWHVENACARARVLFEVN